MSTDAVANMRTCYGFGDADTSRGIFNKRSSESIKRIVSLLAVYRRRSETVLKPKIIKVLFLIVSI